MNALRHINRELDSDFVESRWKHVGQYNEALGRIEMHLESLETQQVNIDGVARSFAAGERIHSENSYKYSQAEFEAMLREAGFINVRVWTDPQQAFWVFWTS